MFLHLEKITVVDDVVDHALDVVWQVRLIRNQRVKLAVGAIDGIVPALARRIFQII